MAAKSVHLTVPVSIAYSYPNLDSAPASNVLLFLTLHLLLNLTLHLTVILTLCPTFPCSISCRSLFRAPPFANGPKPNIKPEPEN